jgi:hypothetical protein
VITGTAIGLLIGLVTGIVFLLLLKTADQASEQGMSVLKVTTEILAIPTFWFGGPWFTTGLLKLVEMDKFINPYLVSLVAVFSLISLYPAARWIIQLGEHFGGKRN